MIDDRQLLRLSRNLANVLIVVVGLHLIVTGAAYATWAVTSLFDSFAGNMSWTSAVQSAIFLASGLLLIFRRNWLARKLIRPAPADTCPGCDYPIDPAASKCPECGLWIAEHSAGSTGQDE